MADKDFIVKNSLQVNTSFSVNSTSFTANGLTANSTVTNAASYTVGSSFRANTTGIYHTGTVNAVSYTIGSSFSANSTVVNAVSFNSPNFVANSTGLYHTNIVNAAIFSVSVNTVANVTGVYTTGTVNAASHTVGTATIANATGFYTTGTINAASYTVGSAFVANATGITLANTTSLFIGNSTVNTTYTSSQLAIANSTNTATLTPTSLTVGSTVVNTSVVQAANLNGAITSSQVTTALGFTPYNATNPDNFANATNTKAINGNANNISAFTINQNVGTTNTPIFAGATLTEPLRVSRSSPNTAQGVIYFGANSGTTYLYYDAANFYFNGGSLYIGSNLTLHAGNYNSYAPGLTGANASGTWAISVTGNANTVTNGVYNNGANYNIGITGNAATANLATLATTANTATYLSTTQQVNPILGAYASMAMSTDSGATRGSFIARATGTGEANLAGMTFLNDAYAIKLGIRADGYFGLGGWSRSAWSWYSAPNGDMVAAGNVSAYSDPRLKENFARVDKPLEMLEKLDGGTFNWKSNIPHVYGKAGKKDYGILANQVEAIMPEIVTDSIMIEGEMYKTVAYDKLVPVLIEAIKELNAKIKVLEGKQ